MGSWGNLESLQRIAAGGNAAQRQERATGRTAQGGGSSGGGQQSAVLQALLGLVQNAGRVGKAQQQGQYLADAYRAATGFGQAPAKITFGQTPKGPYAGWKTEGELKAASLGKGRELYAQDQQRSSDIRTQAQHLADNAHTAYQKALDAAESKVNAATASIRPDALVDRNGHVVGPDALAALERQAAIPPDVTAKFAQVSATPKYGNNANFAENRRPGTITSRVEAPPAMLNPTPEQLGLHHQDVTYADQLKQTMPNGGKVGGVDLAAAMGAIADQGIASQQMQRMYGGDYGPRLTQWQNGETDRAATAQALADTIGKTPFNQYVQQGAVDYGVDPTLAQGWFGPGINDNELIDQRNTQTIADHGMPYTEYQRALDTQAKQNATDQTTASKAAEDQAHTMFLDDAYNQLGADGDQIAQTANLTPEQLGTYLQDPNFQAANQQVQQAVAAAGQGDYQTLTDLTDQMQYADPVMSRIFDAVYGDQIKAALNALQNG